MSSARAELVRAPFPELLRLLAIEAAKEQLAQPALNGGQHWDSDVEGAPDWIVVAAANAVVDAIVRHCEIHDEWTSTYTRPGGEGEQTTAAPSRAVAVQRAAIDSRYGLDPVRVARRWILVFTSAPSVRTWPGRPAGDEVAP